MTKSADFAIVVRAPGGPEALEWTELETTPPARGEVLIAQRAVGVNFIDTYYRKGHYPWPVTPLIPGGEAAGIVEEVGEGTDFKPGLLNSCYAVKAGDLVLVHAAAGGVGLLMGQWLKAIGAISIGTVGSAEKAAIATAGGYTHVINYRTEDFPARVKEITGGSGCAVVYDSVANDTWRGSLKCLHARGMFVCFGQSSGPITDFKFSDLVAGGSLYATRPTLFDYIKTRADLTLRAADLFGKVASGAVKPLIGARMPLRDAAQAHRDLEARKTTGSTILLP